MTEYTYPGKRPLLDISFTVGNSDNDHAPVQEPVRENERIASLTKELYSVEREKNAVKEELFTLRGEYNKAHEDTEKAKADRDAMKVIVESLKKSLGEKEATIQTLSNTIEDLKLDLAIAKKTNEKLMERIVDKAANA